MSFEYGSSEFSNTGIQELSFDEIEQVNGGAGPVAIVAGAALAGAIGGAGLQLVLELADDREGVNFANVASGGIAGAGVAVSATAGALAGIGGTIFFGYTHFASTSSRGGNPFGPTVTVLAGCNEGNENGCPDAV